MAGLTPRIATVAYSITKPVPIFRRLFALKQNILRSKPQNAAVFVSIKHTLTRKTIIKHMPFNKKSISCWNNAVTTSSIVETRVIMFLTAGGGGVGDTLADLRCKTNHWLDRRYLNAHWSGVTEPCGLVNWQISQTHQMMQIWTRFLLFLLLFFLLPGAFAVIFYLSTDLTNVNILNSIFPQGRHAFAEIVVLIMFLKKIKINNTLYSFSSTVSTY